MNVSVVMYYSLYIGESSGIRVVCQAQCYERSMASNVQLINDVIRRIGASGREGESSERRSTER